MQIFAAKVFGKICGKQTAAKRQPKYDDDVDDAEYARTAWVEMANGKLFHVAYGFIGYYFRRFSFFSASPAERSLFRTQHRLHWERAWTIQDWK